MSSVVLISSSIIQPVNTNQSGRPKIHLTPFDLPLLPFDYPQRGLLYPKPNLDSHHLISSLKTSLSHALDIYFPFAGRLVKEVNLEDNTVSFYIDCDDSGVRFLHAEAKSVKVNDVIKPNGYVPEVINQFFPADDYKSCDGVSEPLLVLQVTEMKDGVFIGFGYNHLVADGVCFWEFFNTWSKICSSGSGSFSHKSLVLKRWFLETIDYPIHIPASEAERPPRQSRELSSLPITKDWIFHFTKKNISDFKAKANSEISSNQGLPSGQDCLNDLKISSLQVISAHMWRSIIKHSGLNQDRETHCELAVDMRQRLDPPLEKNSFGNVVYLSPAIAKVEELLNHGLGWAALKIKKVVSSQTNENFKAFAEDWVKNVKNLKSGVGVRTSGDTIIVTSSPRFDVYNNDFGWGKPIAVRAGPCNNVSGKLVLFQGIDEGSIDVQASLWSDVLVKLLDDLEFLEYVTTS